MAKKMIHCPKAGCYMKFPTAKAFKTHYMRAHIKVPDKR